MDSRYIGVENLERGGAFGGLHLNDSRTELFKGDILDILEMWYVKAYLGPFCAHYDEISSELDTVQGEPLTTQKASDEDCLSIAIWVIFLIR